MQLISREYAKSIGLKYYFTGLPCKHGHQSIRLTSSNGCNVCLYISKQSRDLDKINARQRERYIKSYAEKKKIYYIANKDKIQKYRKDNAERLRKSAIDYYHKNREKQRAIAKKNYTKEYGKNYYHKTKHRNAQKWASMSAWRRAAQRKATPSWANENAILEFYSESKRLTFETGIKHHVDHIVPIKSDLVCGLHWEGNLRVITGFENISKHNKLIEELVL